MKHSYFPNCFDLFEMGNKGLVLEGMHMENRIDEYVRDKENSNELVNNGEHIYREDNDILDNNDRDKNDILNMNRDICMENIFFLEKDEEIS